MLVTLGWVALVAFGCFALLDLLGAVRALRQHHMGEMRERLMNMAGMLLCAGGFLWISVQFSSPPIVGFILLFLGFSLSGLSEWARYRRVKRA